nr:hypothetical protein [Kibdelosporangium sp. MJ126-NF4]CTQ91307.1 hypothetical protein [Kibdelosporangium sp. MJ126-NF4]
MLTVALGTGAEFASFELAAGGQQRMRQLREADCDGTGSRSEPADSATVPTAAGAPPTRSIALQTIIKAAGQHNR